MHLSIFCFYPFTAANVGKQRSTERKEFFLYKPSCENKKKKSSMYRIERNREVTVRSKTKQKGGEGIEKNR